MKNSRWRTSLLFATLLAAMVFASGCVNPGHFAGGGQLQLGFLTEGFSNTCDQATPANCQRAPFSLNLQALDRDKDGLLDEGDTFKGHLSIQLPPGAPIKRINANVLFGGVCTQDNPSCFLLGLFGYLCYQTPDPVCQILPFFAPVVNSPVVTDYVKLHPKQGSSFFGGFFRQSAKNPDNCAPEDVDCVPYFAVAFDGDQSNGPSVNDGILFFSPAVPPLIGFVEKGNLSITSATVPTN